MHSHISPERVPSTSSRGESVKSLGKGPGQGDDHGSSHRSLGSGRTGVGSWTETVRRVHSGELGTPNEGIQSLANNRGDLLIPRFTFTS